MCNSSSIDQSSTPVSLLVTSTFHSVNISGFSETVFSETLLMETTFSETIFSEKLTGPKLCWPLGLWHLLYNYVHDLPSPPFRYFYLCFLEDEIMLGLKTSQRFGDCIWMVWGGWGDYGTVWYATVVRRGYYLNSLPAQIEISQMAGRTHKKKYQKSNKLRCAAVVVALAIGITLGKIKLCRGPADDDKKVCKICRVYYAHSCSLDTYH